MDAEGSTAYGFQNKSSKRINKICCAIIIGALLIAIGLAIGLAVGLGKNNEEGQRTKQPTLASAFGKYRAAAVASDSAICSKIGADVIMLKGGSAIDAAIATLLCNGLANSQSMGLGGGFFMTIYNSTSKTSEVLIAREKAPIKATVDMFAPEKGVSSQDGAKAIAVPGEIAGYWEAHQKYGRLPWKDLFEPSIKLARNGIPISKELEDSINRFKNKFDIYPGLKKLFYNEKKKAAKKKGDTFTRPEVANTLERLANGNGQTYYEGSLADDIIADITDAGGIISKEDLKQYRAVWAKPLVLDFGDGKKLYTVPPPAGGVVLGYIINILDGYHFSKDDLSTDEKAILTYHRIVEAMKFGFAKRTNLGDADFVDVTQLVKNMTSKEFGASIRKLIDDDQTHDTMFYGPTFYDYETTGTAHLSVLDKDGIAVAVTSTINTRFGSKVVGTRTGIIFNNQMDDFSTPNITNRYGVKPSPANLIQPGKRPLSSMSPSVITDADGEVQLMVGASGGTRIITACTLTYLNALRFGQDVNEAIDARRIHHQLLPKELKVEEGFPKIYIDGLRRKGHIVQMEKPDKGRVQAILRKGSEIQACSDFRKRGEPFGY